MSIAEPTGTQFDDHMITRQQVCIALDITRNDMMGNKPHKVQNRAWTTTLGGYLAYNLLFITIVLYNVATIVAFYYFYSSRRFVSTVIACLPIVFFGQLSQFFIVFSLFTGASARGEQYFDGNVWPKFARDFPIFVIMRKYLNLTIHNIPKELKEAEAQLGTFLNEPLKLFHFIN